MGVRASTIVKYSKFLAELKQHCINSVEVVNVAEFIKMTGVDHRVLPFLLSMNIIAPDKTLTTGIDFKDKRDTMQIARELGHAMYKVRYAARESTTAAEVIAGKDHTIMSISTIERQMLVMVLENNQHPYLHSFTKEFLQKLNG